MHRRLEDGGFKHAFDPISIKFVPTEEILSQCQEAGEKLGEVVTKAKNRQSIEKKKRLSSTEQATVDTTAAAVGHIVTSPCVLTCRNPVTGVESIMMASWISQASFSPPGLSVALAKENSPEGVCLLNSKFCLSVVSASNQKIIKRKLLNKGYLAGPDAFVDLETEESETHKCKIINDSQSYLECTVVDRMDAGDHWVLYANVDSGKELAKDAGLYFHHRPTGATY